MGQIANGRAKGEMTYNLETQSGYDASDREWRGKGTYNLKMHSRYDGSDGKWLGKRRRDVLPEGAEQARWVRSQPRGKGRKDILAERTIGQIANGVAKGEWTYILKMQSGYDGSDHEWLGKGRKDVLAEGVERVRWVRSRMAWQTEKGRTFWRCTASTMGQIANGMAKGEVRTIWGCRADTMGQIENGMAKG
jgi:hypothetical protein